MATSKLLKNGTTRNISVGDRVEYRLLVAIALPICLAMTASRRLTGNGQPTPYSGGSKNGESLFAEARSAAHAAVGYAFVA